MNPSAILFAITLIERLPGLVKAGIDTAELVSTGKAKLEQFQKENRDPTPQEWSDLNGRLTALESRLQRAGS